MNYEAASGRFLHRTIKRALIEIGRIFLGEREATSTVGGNFVAVENERSTNYDDVSLPRTVTTRRKKRSRVETFSRAKYRGR